MYRFVIITAIVTRTRSQNLPRCAKILPE
jgi:hypothetical protein